MILTASGVFPETEGKWGYKARTDINSEVLHKSEWFRFPYPGEVKVYGEVYNLSRLNVHTVRTATGQKIDIRKIQFRFAAAVLLPKIEKAPLSDHYA